MSLDIPASNFERGLKIETVDGPVGCHQHQGPPPHDAAHACAEEGSARGGGLPDTALCAAASAIFRRRRGGDYNPGSSTRGTTTHVSHPCHSLSPHAVLSGQSSDDESRLMA
jgi:hypothetical protein